MKRFIVTGGYGFIGSNLVHALIKKNFKVLNIDNLSYAAQRYNLRDIKSKNYSFKRLDINNKKEIIKTHYYHNTQMKLNTYNNLNHR